MWWLERYGFHGFITPDGWFIIYSKTKQQCIIQIEKPWEEMGLQRDDVLLEDILDWLGWRIDNDVELYDIYAPLLGMEALAMLITLANEPQEILG